MTKLSVIVPCYDVQDHVRQTLDSLRRNAAPDFEFLLVDDGSTDATPEMLADQADAVPGARIITLPANVGVAAARNVGLRAAEGDYITFLDGDDFYAPGYLTELLATIERLGCEMVRADHVRVHGRKRTVHRISHGPRGLVMRPRDAILPVRRATSVDAPNAWAGIYHRSVAEAGLLDFAEDLHTCEDRLWNWRLHLSADRFAVVGLLGVFYRRDVATSLTQITDERQLHFLAAHDQIFALVAADREAERLLPKAVWAYCAIVCHHLDQAARFSAPLGARLREQSALSLRRLPDALLRDVTEAMDARRQGLLRDLLEAA